jgi:hypothetical protein
MGHERLLTRPRPAPQVVVAECAVENFSLVEPARMGQCEPRTPPPATRPEVVSCPDGGVARIAVMDQVHAPEVMMTTTEPLQPLDVMCRIFRHWACRFHPAAVNDQNVQDVYHPMPGVLELLLFDRARNRSTDRVAFKNLMVGDLIGADHPIAPLGRAVGVGVPPQDLFGPLLELGIQASRPPVTGPVRFDGRRSLFEWWSRRFLLRPISFLDITAGNNAELGPGPGRPILSDRVGFRDRDNNHFTSTTSGKPLG